MAKDTFITPAGIAKFPHIAKPDNYKGQEKYKTWLVLTPEDAEIVKKKLLEFVAANKTTITTKKPKLASMRPEEDRDGEETGNLEITAKSDYQPAVYDSKNQRLSGEVRLGGGSKIRLLVEPFAYDDGVSLRLKQVQVIELHEYGSGGASGFDQVEDGYEAEEGFGEAVSESDNSQEDALEI
jgi:hypothetical protein